ncbi:MAG: gliding motility-associated C-terminal domain-containing protein [bacterium]
MRVEFSQNPTGLPLEVNIYDVAGDLVWEKRGYDRVDGNALEIDWDGRNGNQKPVANGVYFARVIVDLGHKKQAKIIKIAIIR